MVAPLHVWMNGRRVGVWAISRGSHSFTYDADWPSFEWSRSLTLSMPSGPSLKYAGARVSNYFDNLLPDSEHIRKRIQARYRTGSVEAFDLLTAIGRDCVGAVQLLPEKELPEGFDRITSSSLTEVEVEHHLRQSMSGTPLAGQQEQDDFRISIAGAQEKTALLRLNGEWHLPHGMTPTTHILKLPLGFIGPLQHLDMRTSVENEWLCLELLGMLGFKVARTEVAQFGATKALVVERFDRAWMDQGRWIARLPQEDFCQVRGVSSAQKYEKEGGPGIAKIMASLATSSRREEDSIAFLCAQFAFWLLAATDGHAKNFSVSIRPHDAFFMTPLYDVLSVWPIIGPKGLPYERATLAMAVRRKNAHRRLAEIQPGHWLHLAVKNGFPGAWERMKTMAEHVGSALGELEGRLPQSFPEQVFRSISKGAQRHASLFLRGVGAAEAEAGHNKAAVPRSG